MQINKTNLNNTKTRNSSVELLRIISMLTIIAVHYLGNNSLGELASSFSIEGELYILLNSILNYGVNIFVVISGYYLSEKTECSVRKIVKLLFDVSFYGMLMYFISIAIGINSFSLVGLGKSVLPIFAGYRWFVKAYLVLYLLSPFIAKMISQLNKKSHLTLIVISGIMLSIWPFFLPNPPIDDYGFSFVNFIFIFIIAGYVKRYIIGVKPQVCLVLFVSSTLITVVLQSLKAIGFSFWALNGAASYALAHNSPFNIIASLSIFLLFANYNYHSRIINSLAGSAFAVFLIHGDFNMMSYIFNTVFKAERFQAHYLWIPHMIITCIVIYVICYVIDIIKIHSVDIMINKLFDKSKVVNYRIKS